MGLFRFCNPSRGFILPSIPFLDPDIVSPPPPPYPTLSGTPVFLPCAALALSLPLLARFAHLCATSTLIYCTVSRFLSCHTLPWRAVFAVCCDRTFPLGRSTHSHLPAGPGEGFWEGLPACRLASGLQLAPYVSAARLQVGTFFSFSRQPVVCLTFTGRVLAARAGLLYVKTLYTQTL